MHNPTPKPRRASPSTRKTLRLSKDTVRALHGIRLAASFPVRPFTSWAMPAAASLIANGALVAICAWTVGNPLDSPPVEHSIVVTMLDRDPEPALDNPRQAAAAIPGEPRAAAAPAEVPPPPAHAMAPAEWPALGLRLTRHVDPVAVTPLWSDSLVVSTGTGRAFTPALPSAGGSLGAYWQQVRSLIAAKAVYPPAAVRRNASGQVVLRVRIGPHGELIDTGVATSSADGALDRAALSAVREAAPFPVGSLGSGGHTNELDALIPVRFELVDGPAGR